MTEAFEIREKQVRLRKRPTLRDEKRMSTKSVSRYKTLLTKQVDINLHVVSHFNIKHLLSALH